MMEKDTKNGQRKGFLTEEEMREEIILRMENAGISDEAIEIFRNGEIPVTLFSGELGKEEKIIHKKILEYINKIAPYSIPYYIVESKNLHEGDEFGACDVISVLYHSGYKKGWRKGRLFPESGIHYGYAYNLTVPEWSEPGEGLFEVRNGLLIRTF